MRTPRVVAGAYDGEQLLDARLEGVVGDGVAGLGGVPLPPGGRVELPADLEVGALGRQRQHGDTAEQPAVGRRGDRPPAGRAPVGATRATTR